MSLEFLERIFFPERAWSRKNHPYNEERKTPKKEIPFEYRKKLLLPGGRSQIIDTRLCYNCNTNGEWVECGSVWSHAKQEGFVSPKDKN